MKAAYFKYFCTKILTWKLFFKVQDKKNRCALQGFDVKEDHVRKWHLSFLIHKPKQRWDISVTWHTSSRRWGRFLFISVFPPVSLKKEWREWRKKRREEKRERGYCKGECLGSPSDILSVNIPCTNIEDILGNIILDVYRHTYFYWQKDRFCQGQN